MNPFAISLVLNDQIDVKIEQMQRQTVGYYTVLAIQISNKLKSGGLCGEFQMPHYDRVKIILTGDDIEIAKNACTSPIPLSRQDAFMMRDAYEESNKINRRYFFVCSWNFYISNLSNS